MNRVIVYPDALPQDTDILNTNKNTMIGLGYALQAILGTNTLFDGLACGPTTPASMQVQVQSGSCYAYKPIDATAYGSIGSDTTDFIVKQGIAFSSTNFTCAAPATSGQSVVYLIQGQYQDVDGGSVVLPYYNAFNPSVPYSGPGNAGTPNYTQRQGVCILSLKGGTPATTGTQTTPAPDAGYTALWAITVANGQTTITSGNIAQVGTPFIGTKLVQRLDPARNLSEVASPSTALANLGGAPTANPVFSGVINNNGAAGASRLYGSETGGVQRWLWGAGSDAESGSNAGSSFYLVAYNDAGVVIDDPLVIPRAAGTPIATSRLISGQTAGNGDNSTLLATTAWFFNQFFANQSLNLSGYLKLPGGLIVQWGAGTTTGGGSTTITFPLTFPNAVYSPVLGLLSTSPVNAYTGYGSLTTSGMSIFTNAAGAGAQLGTVTYIILGR